MSLFPTAHLVSAVDDHRDWGILPGTLRYLGNDQLMRRRPSRTAAAFVVTSTNSRYSDGYFESKLMWNFALTDGEPYTGVTFWNAATPFSVNEDGHVFAHRRFSMNPTGAVRITTSDTWYLMKDLQKNLYVYDDDLLLNLNPTSPPAPLYWILSDRVPPNYTKFIFRPDALDRLETLPTSFPPIFPGQGETSTPIVPQLALLGESTSQDQSSTTDLVISQGPMRTMTVDPRIGFHGFVAPRQFIQYYPLSTRWEWAVLTGYVHGRGNLAAFVASFDYMGFVGHYPLKFRRIESFYKDFIPFNAETLFSRTDDDLLVMEPRLSVAADGEVLLNVNRHWVTLQHVANHLYVSYKFIAADEGDLYYIPPEKEEEYQVSRYRQFIFSKESREMLDLIGLRGDGDKRKKLECGEPSRQCTP